jgi:Na+/serine symporter
MNINPLKIAALLILLPVMAKSQNELSSGSSEESNKKILYGFVRGGFIQALINRMTNFTFPVLFLILH